MIQTLYTDTDSPEKHGNVAGWFKAIANGEPQVERLCRALWNFEHVLDDLVDGDRAVTQGQAAKAFAELWTELCLNPWFHQHRLFLWQPVCSAVDRWVAGDLMSASPQPHLRELSVAVRCGDLDVFLSIADCVGGWEHRRNMAAFRSYDRDPVNEKGD
jgi:hypothetical protein